MWERSSPSGPTFLLIYRTLIFSCPQSILKKYSGPTFGRNKECNEWLGPNFLVTDCGGENNGRTKIINIFPLTY